MISPVASTAQIFQISEPGKERVLPLEPIESLSLMDTKFNGMSGIQLKSYFSKLQNLKKYYFEPEVVYTVSFHSDRISPSSYTVHLMGTQWGVQKYLPSPIQLCDVVLSDKGNGNNEDKEDLNENEFLINLQLWHRNLVEKLYPELL